MDEMNEHDLVREIDRDVSNRNGQILLWVCLGVVAVVMLAGAVILRLMLKAQRGIIVARRVAARR